ncbi:hypothetical protein [Microlunatus sp. Gsoil 973]|jgi:hypothetical protein|uniref:hypothetical protein n=1 Tax=Microlunatus sp. Gsoil 973 TaxID=2672569 RepID=UPI0012B4C0F3|nr:hypothetical protein [Microlunatus sp. Gsoil 973]QGN33616.1 hypothetical protein GJV80_13260 [Microlunatus sp. Gsoil 973]
MSAQPPPWNATLAYAITGQQWSLPESGRPDPVLIAREIELRFPGGLAAVRSTITERRRAGESWPYQIPAGLRAELGAAQWLAALGDLSRRLGVGPQPERPVLSDRKPDADEERLLREVPPHHGH